MSRLEIEDLSIRYGDTTVVDRVSFVIDAGQSVGLVGESGAGKSQTALAILGLLPGNAVVSGAVRFAGEDLLGAGEARLRRFRSRRIAMVFQDPSLALNPYLSVGHQLAEVLKAHRFSNGGQLRQRIVAALERVELPDPERQFDRYPHELSGGMRQRVMLAAALLGEPELLIADEPTTALDVTVQAQILDLLDSLRDEMALLLITHDLGVIAGHCERMLVLDKGRLLEAGDTLSVFRAPSEPRTRELLDASRTAGGVRAEVPEPRQSVLEVDSLDVRYSLPRGQVLSAVRRLDLSLSTGETLAIVGESGSGKSSLARAVAGLVNPAAGTVEFRGEPLPPGTAARSLHRKRAIQLVFQDPSGSLSPSLKVRDILLEPLAVHEPGLAADVRERRVREVAADVDLDDALLDRYPHELSGGQAQRVAIARALVLKPELLICDEAVAALDGRVRNGVLELLRSAQARSGLAILFISHDLSVVERLAHRVLVMYLGRVVESGPAARVFAAPAHPYTRALLAAVPRPDPLNPGGRAVLSGEVPSALKPPSGCVFRSRCAHAQVPCGEQVPPTESVPGGDSRHVAACLRLGDPELSDPVRASPAERR